MKVKVDWIDIPRGTVVRGTPTGEISRLVREHVDLDVPEAWLLKECPQTEQEVQGFVIARTPVTVAQYRTFVQHALDADDGLAAAPDEPIHGVTFLQAQAFCAWASEQLSFEVRLPTELEWERAARGSDGREYPWGDSYDRDRCNLVERGLGGPCPVGVHPAGASPFGCLDMAGNVDEWTSTRYAPYDQAPEAVPQTEAWALDPHITRGGAWYHHRDLARCARRHGVYHRYDGVGLRLVTSEL